MKKRRIQRSVAGTWLGLFILLAGCGPVQEESVENKLLIPSYEATQLHTGTVKRGNLESEETMHLHAQAAYTQELYFGISGVPYGEVFVEEGDVVEAGELLARLSCKELEEELILLEAEAKELAIEIEHAEIQLQQAMDKSELNEDDEMTNQDEISRCRLALDGFLSDLAVNQSTMAEKQALLEKHRIYAGASGVVTKIADDRGGVSDEKLPFIVLETEGEVLVGDTGEKCSFKQGESIIVYVDDESYPAVFAQVSAEGERTEVKVSLQTGYSLPEGKKSGEIRWSNGTVENVLYVPKEALVSVGEDTYVYELAQDGLPELRKVKTGARTDAFVQLTEGVTEGMEVVLY